MTLMPSATFTPTIATARSTRTPIPFRTESPKPEKVFVKQDKDYTQG